MGRLRPAYSDRRIAGRFACPSQREGFRIKAPAYRVDRDDVWDIGASPLFIGTVVTVGMVKLNRAFSVTAADIYGDTHIHERVTVLQDVLGYFLRRYLLSVQRIQCVSQLRRSADEVRVQG